MLIRKTKYRGEIRNAYVRGLEQGYELAIKLREITNQKGKESGYLSDRESKKFSLLLHQLLEIAKTKGIDLE
jgi:hypothetical protein